MFVLWDLKCCECCLNNKPSSTCRVIQKQMAFMLGRHGMFLELNEDVEDYEDLTEIMSNVQLNSNFLALAREVRHTWDIGNCVSFFSPTLKNKIHVQFLKYTWQWYRHVKLFYLLLALLPTIIFLLFSGTTISQCIFRRRTREHLSVCQCVSLSQTVRRQEGVRWRGQPSSSELDRWRNWQNARRPWRKRLNINEGSDEWMTDSHRWKRGCKNAV